uniref:G_PROTEIN_RECEP_F1_2 domain-containing protein n=1 Tax=Strongyloides venezuelensis TaxID=75913 RepID=A0A0K0F608_STRVS
MSSNATEICNFISPMALQKFLMLYIFPIQFTVGIIGNLLNLIVLLSHSMRSKTNNLLAIMALADTIFLLCNIHQSFALSSIRTLFTWFRRFLLHSKFHWIGLTNMCSFISAWLIVLVSLERVTAISFPLKSRHIWNSKILIIIVCSVIMASFILTLHWHITHTVEKIIINVTTINETTGLEEISSTKTLQQLAPREGMLKFSIWSSTLEMIFLVIVPVTIVLTLNILLVHALRKQRTCDVKSQKRATKIVLIIATTFTLCNVPSAALQIWKLLSPSVEASLLFFNLATLSNSLVITGKISNFYLFCSWSEHYRKKFCKIVEKELPRLFWVARAVNAKKQSYIHKMSSQNTTTTESKQRPPKVKQYSVRTLDENGEIVERLIK